MSSNLIKTQELGKPRVTPEFRRRNPWEAMKILREERQEKKRKKLHKNFDVNIIIERLENEFDNGK